MMKFDEQIFFSLPDKLSPLGLSLLDLVSVSLSVASMSSYAAANAAYVSRMGGSHPACRVCVEAADGRDRIHAVGFKRDTEDVSCFLTR